MTASRRASGRLSIAWSYMAARLAPWDRRPDESAVAYEAFAAYRDMGPTRKLEAVSTALHKSVPLLGRWSARHEWVARAAAFDTEAARRAGLASLDDHTEARIRQARLGRMLQDAAADAIANAPDDQRTAGWAVQAAKTGAELERAALGMTDKRLEVKAKLNAALAVRWPEDLRAMVDAELAALDGDAADDAGDDDGE